jgi:hypothetical protein
LREKKLAGNAALKEINQSDEDGRQMSERDDPMKDEVILKS